MTTETTVALPPAPMPLGILIGVVNTAQGGSVIMVTATNPSGCMLQGYLTPGQARQVGESLLQAANAAEGLHLVVPPSGLVLPASR